MPGPRLRGASAPLGPPAQGSQGRGPSKPWLPAPHGGKARPQALPWSCHGLLQPWAIQASVPTSALAIALYATLDEHRRIARVV